jgi:hypothetical protein
MLLKYAITDKAHDLVALLLDHGAQMTESFTEPAVAGALLYSSTFLVMVEYQFERLWKTALQYEALYCRS